MEHTGMKKGSKAKVRNSWGVYDCYKLLRKNGWKGICHPVTEGHFYAIIRGINDMMADNIAHGIQVKLPFQMGWIELRKYKRGVSFVDGKLKNTYPVDWYNTKLLWERDEEARKNKIRLRHENEWVYHISYNKNKAKYNNKVFYHLAVNTFIKRALCKNIKQGKADTLW